MRECSPLLWAGVMKVKKRQLEKFVTGFFGLGSVKPSINVDAFGDVDC